MAIGEHSRTADDRPPGSNSLDKQQFHWHRFLVALLVIALGLLMYDRLPRTHTGAQQPDYIISGSFGSPALYVLKFDRAARALTVVRRVSGHGPHQYLHYDQSKRRLYATSWAEPAHLSAWEVGFHDTLQPTLTLINQAPITSVSSYITSKHGLLFSVGGPTGEIHILDPETGKIEEKIQELLFVSKEALPHEDKSRKALRDGSHAIEVSSRNQAFVPHLGHNSIWMYQLNGHQLELLSESKSPGAGDGPRHCVVSEDGRRVYVVTEHTSRVDLYETGPATLTHRGSAGLIDPPASADDYRGDTVRLLPSALVPAAWRPGEFIFATTRGAAAARPGVLAVFEYDPHTGTLATRARWPTPTSGGKANAIEFRPTPDPDRSAVELVLTDDELGWLWVLEWDFNLARIQVLAKCLIDQSGIGASHALWVA